MRRFATVLAALIVALLIAAGCGRFGSTETTDVSGSKKTSKDKVTAKPFDAAERKRAGCTKDEEPENKGSEHVEGDVEYKDNPPTSGNHNAVPLDWGIYEEESPSEKWVHNLEHGHVVVLYKDLSASQYKTLRKYVKRDPYHIVLVPRKASPKDGVYFMAWDFRLYCKKPSAPALQYVLNTRRDQGPELFMTDPSKGK